MERKGYLMLAPELDVLQRSGLRFLMSPIPAWAADFGYPSNF